MSEKLSQLMSAMTETGHVTIDQQEFIQLVNSYLQDVTALSEDVVAIVDTKVNDENKRMFATICATSMPYSVQMVATLLGLSGDLATFASVVTHGMLGYLIDKGYITIVRLPEVTDPTSHMPVVSDLDDDADEGLLQ